MKRQCYIYAALIAATIIGCTEEIDVQRLPAPSEVEILPQAAVAQSRSDLTGTQDGPLFPPSTDNVFAVSAFLSSNGTDADIPYFLNQPLKSDAEGNFHFYNSNGLRYYPEDGSKLYFYAFSPACATQDKNDPKKVSWTLTGQEDIMYAKDLTGLSKAIDSSHPQPTFNFQHLLARLNFNCRIGIGFPNKIPITQVKITTSHKEAELDLISGELTYTDSKPEDPDDRIIEYPCYHIIEHYNGSLTGTEYNRICTIMCAPVDEFKLYITTSYDVVRGPYIIKSRDFKTPTGESFDEFRANYSYNINMAFQADEVIMSTSIEPWIEGGHGTITE